MCKPASHCSLENLLSQIPFKLHPNPFFLLSYIIKGKVLIFFPKLDVFINAVYQQAFSFIGDFLQSNSPFSNCFLLLSHHLQNINIFSTQEGKSNICLTSLEHSEFEKIYSSQVHIDHSPEKSFDESQRKNLLR